MKSYIFGKIENNFSIESVLAEAKKRRKNIRNYPVEKIIDVLNKTSKLWENPSYHLRKKAMNIMPHLTSFHKTMIEEEINFLVDLLKKENLEKRIKCELQNKKFLDGWCWSDNLGGHLRVGPRGVVVHIGAGNVFVGPIDSLIQGIITKNVNILKLSSDDPAFPILFCESLREADHEKIISSSISALFWKGADEKIEPIIKKEADVIVVYGGKQTVESYRNGLALHTKLVEYGPKYSLVLVSREMFKNVGTGRDLSLQNREKSTLPPFLNDMAYKIAYDAARWEQSACASPHVIYVEEGEKKGVNAQILASGLASAFSRLQKILPQKKLTVDEQIEITRTRQLAMAANAFDSAEYKFGKGKSAWSIIIEKDPRFTISPLNRTIFIKSVGTGRDLSLQDVPKLLKPMGHYIQTVAIEAPEDIRKKIADSFSFIGADRFTGIGEMTRRVHGAPHDGVYSLEQLIRWSSLTGENNVGNQCFVRAQNLVPVRAQNLVPLRELISFARANSPFYKNKFKNIKLKTVGNRHACSLQNIPITTPGELKKHLPPKGSGALTQPQADGYVFTSGGTTGDPKFVFRTIEEQNHNARFLAKGLLAAALDKGDTVANLLFAGNMWGSFLSFSKALEEAQCRILPIGGNISTEEILNYLVLFKPDAVLAIPSVLLSLANLAETKKLKIKIPKILSGGEHIFKENINYIKKIFNSERIASIGYATNDVGAIGYQCRYLEGGFHHIHRELQYVEILNPKTLKPAKIGEEGKVIVTNLNRHLQPIIRYDVGDMGRWVNKKCPCGESGPVFELLGRSDDVLIIGGGNIYPEVIREAIESVGAKGSLPLLSPHFSLIARLNKGKDELVVRVESVGARHNVGAQNLVPVRAQNLVPLQEKLQLQIYANSKELRTMADKKLIAPVVVEILPPHSLPCNPRTGKIRMVEDRRR